MKRIFQFVILGGILIVLNACNHKVVFDKYETIDNHLWNKDSVLVFEIPVTDTRSNHNFYVNVRNDVNYSYSNLWLFISIEQPNGEQLNEKFEITLADPAGKWLGTGFGGLKTCEVIFRDNVFFPVSGTYKVSVKQGMRENILEGISDVGIRIEKVKS